MSEGITRDWDEVSVELSAININRLRSKFKKEIEKIREECDHPKIWEFNSMDGCKECRRCGKEL